MEHINKPNYPPRSIKQRIQWRKRRRIKRWKFGARKHLSLSLQTFLGTKQAIVKYGWQRVTPGKRLPTYGEGKQNVSRGMGSENNRMGSRDDRNPVVLAKLSFSKTSQQEQQLETQITGRAKNHASPPYCTSNQNQHETPPDFHPSEMTL